MRICIVSDLYYPHIGGVSTHIHNIYLELKKFGHFVKILTTNYRNLEKYEVDVFRVGFPFTIYANKSIVVYPIVRNKNKVKEFILSNNFDIMHFHTPYFSLPTIAVKYSKGINVMTFHYGAKNVFLLYKFLAKALSSYIKKLDGVIPVSTTTLKTMKELGINFDKYKIKYRIIPNGVDLEKFSTNVKPLPKFMNKCKKILFVGRLEPRKGLKYLIDAFYKVKKKIKNVELIIVGRSLWKEYKCVKDGIHFVGYVPHSELPSYYRSSNVFCAPTVGGESFGMILIEAMACGIPVIATNIEGYNDIIKDGVNGILVPPRSSSALVDAIIRVLTNEELSNNLVTEGLRFVSNFSWKNITQNIIEFYNELINERL